jgi:hypothetical protein
VGACLVVAGDQKGPQDYSIDGHNDAVYFLSLNDQLDSPFELARLLPTGHYSRKNIGYLHAIAQDASCIYETDDDNAPLPAWKKRNEYLENARIVETRGDKEQTQHWVNVYRYFSNENIWPRGLPLDAIHDTLPSAIDGHGKVWAPIQQGLVNGSPDVDAIWRLTMDHKFEFDNKTSVYLEPRNWCPFNTQSTWWWPVAYPLLYVPSNCSFRMCDIWKSFVAQRCLWELNAGVAFHAPEVVQERNIHDLMRDFQDEIPGYNLNRQLANVLMTADLLSGEKNVSENVYKCYEALVTENIFPDCELELVSAWLNDLQVYWRGQVKKMKDKSTEK